MAHTGQEYVWQKVWRSFGLAEQDVAEHFSGPSFLAWNRMGNLRGYAGPLPQSYIDDQAGARGRGGSHHVHPSSSLSAHHARARLSSSWQSVMGRGFEAHLRCAVMDLSCVHALWSLAGHLSQQHKLKRSAAVGAALQRRILARMRSFGMTPVFPAFAGFVPAALAAQRPNVNITRHGSLRHPSACWNCQIILLCMQTER